MPFGLPPDEDETPRIFDTTYVCPGLSFCSLVGDAAVRAQQAGCLWCRKEHSWTDGDFTIVGPIWDMPDDLDDDEDDEAHIEHIVQTDTAFARHIPETYRPAPGPIVTERPDSRWTMFKWTTAHRLLEWAVRVMPQGRAKGSLIRNLIEYNRQNRR